MITLDVINTDHDIILGKPWLMRHNPRIDWRTNQVDMTNCKCRDTKIHRVWIKQEWLNMEKEGDQEPIPNEYMEFRELFRESHQQKRYQNTDHGTMKYHCKKESIQRMDRYTR